MTNSILISKSEMPSISNLQSAIQNPQMPRYDRRVMSNDLVLLVSEEHTLPIVSVYLLLDAGSWRDPPDGEGLANLAVNTLSLGSGLHSEREISEILDFNGASLESLCGRDFAVLGLHTLKRNFEKVFGIFQEMLLDPTFPEEEIQRRIAETRAAVRSSRDQPGIVAEKAFREALFITSPYRHSVEGEEESLQKITHRDLVDFYHKFYRPNLGILAVVGDIEPREAGSLIEEPLLAWAGTELPAGSFESEFAEGPEAIQTRRPIDQAHIILGHRGIARPNQDFYALAVMNHILGAGGFGSRLLEAIRVKRGLAYSVRSTFHTLKHPASFQITMQTKHASAAEAIRIALDQMEKIRKGGVTEQELATAKKYLTGQFHLNFVKRDDFARFIARVEYYGLGKDYYDKYPAYIESISRSDVHRVAKEYLHPDQCLLSVVADLDKIDLS